MGGVHGGGLDLELELLAGKNQRHRLEEGGLERLEVGAAPRVRREQLGGDADVGEDVERLGDGCHLVGEEVEDEREDVVLVACLVVVGVQLVDHHLDQLVDLGGLGAAEERGDVLRLLVQLRHHPFVQLLLEVEVDLGGPQLDPVVAVRPRERLLHHFVVLQHEAHLVLHVEALGLELVVAAHLQGGEQRGEEEGEEEAWGRARCPSRVPSAYLVVELLFDLSDLRLLVRDDLRHILALRLHQLLQHVERRTDRLPRHRHRHHRRHRRRLVLLGVRHLLLQPLHTGWWSR